MRIQTGTGVCINANLLKRRMSELKNSLFDLYPGKVDYDKEPVKPYAKMFWVCARLWGQYNFVLEIWKRYKEYDRTDSLCVEDLEWLLLRRLISLEETYRDFLEEGGFFED